MYVTVPGLCSGHLGFLCFGRVLEIVVHVSGGITFSENFGPSLRRDINERLDENIVK